MFKITVNIDGMMCENCEKHMNEAFKEAFHPKKVSSDHEAKKSELISKEEIPEEKLKAVVEDTGYVFLGFTAEPYEKKGLFF